MKMTAKVVAFSVGYVLGTRAGRQRYGQIAAAGRYAAKRLEDYGAGGSLAQSHAPDRANRSRQS